MAYQPHNLSVLSYANGFTLWHYRTSDSVNDVDTVGYFNMASAMLRVGDFLLVNGGVGTVATHGLMVVLSNAGGVVDVSNMTPFATANTD